MSFFTVAVIAITDFRCSFMPLINNETLELTYPKLGPGEKLHVVINHDKMSVRTNEQRHQVWLAEGQQPLHKKGNDQSIHVSDFILETTGRLALTAA